MSHETPDVPPSKEELAALELYHQLVNLSPDNGDRALMLTLRTPTGRYIGDVWLSQTDVEQLIDGTLTISQHRVAYGDPEQAAAPLPLDEGDITDEFVDGMTAEFEEFLKSEGGQA
ncbi:hypothetical protein AB0G67_40455 [Streptomyces sp. NPDC021056]|uniref:hypothetical protein n=1 Tax=Streptomyces sp. NPDC021056 TaxID=3155012 RepID=UPI00340F64B3